MDSKARSKGEVIHGHGHSHNNGDSHQHNGDSYHVQLSNGDTSTVTSNYGDISALTSPDGDNIKIVVGRHEAHDNDDVEDDMAR